MNDFSQIDMRQLRVLLTLLEERSVTRTAQILDCSQPYISLVLKKLRTVTGDKILVRSGAKLVLTERGQAMLEPARAILAGIEQIVSEPRPFDPRTEEGTFRIASADCIETLILPQLAEKVRDEAPNARLVVHPVDRTFDYAGALERGELDALICNWPGAPEHLKTKALLHEEIDCIFSEHHRFGSMSEITIDDYLAAKHVAPVARSKADPGPIDSQLARHGLKRDIQLMIPEFNLIPHVLLSTDLVFTSSRHFARHFCSLLPLERRPAPVECGELGFYLLWHERAHEAGRNAWLRSKIMAVAKGLQASGEL